MNLAKTAFGLSILLLAGLCVLLYYQTRPDPGQAGPPLVVYCAEALRVPMEAIAKEYEAETKQHVELRNGPSQTILTQLANSGKGDLFLPADDSYIDLAKKKDLIAEVLPLATMHATVIFRSGFDKKIEHWNDALAPGVKLGLANPEAAAISKLLKAHLEKAKLWQEVLDHKPNFLGSVNEVASAVNLGTVDVGVIWDAVAVNFAKVKSVSVPELKGVTAQVQIAVAKTSAQPTQALRFARYVAAKDRGLLHLQKQGFEVQKDADTWARVPNIVIFAGTMLRPAIEETLTEFEQREGVRITTVYDGCGNLVGQMKAGKRPDCYFACDTRFMDMVQNRFNEPEVMSKNQLVIAMRKGNPHEIHTLKDLAKPGLRIGVGHEQQCALGSITKETFLQTGTYAAIRKNVRAEFPSGDALIVQIRGGSLDAVVAYRSNVTPFVNELEMIPVTGIPCAAPQQPIAIGKECPYPQLARRLWAALKTPESKQRFVDLGFGWEAN